MVLVAGDHGEGLGEHGEQAHGMLVYDSTLRVPLIVTGPAIPNPNTIIEGNVSLASVGSFLVRVAGLANQPSMTKGPDLLDESETYSETQYPHAAGWHALTALTASRWKLILSSEPELYDVWSDFSERHNIAADKPTIVAGMTRRLGELSATTPARPPAPVSAEAAERLRALGYVSASPSAPADDDKAPNPARHIAAWTRFEGALSDLNSRKASAALPVLNDLAADYPDARVFQATYARALKDTGKARTAVEIYRKAIARWPNDASLYHDLSIAARAAGDAREAMRAEEAALVLEGSNAAALNGLGLLQAEAGFAAKAAESFEQATAQDPSNTSFWTNLGNARRGFGDLDRAEQAYRRALQIDATYADASNGLGVVLVQRKRPLEAIPFLERAVRHDPELYEAQLNLGIALQESGDRAKAMEVYRRLIATTSPSAARERKAAAELLRSLRRP